jgi:hypothetical protein
VQLERVVSTRDSSSFTAFAAAFGSTEALQIVATVASVEQTSHEFRPNFAPIAMLTFWRRPEMI